MTTRATANLNLRPEAGTGNTPILVIPNGSAVTVGPVDVNGTLWYPVTYDGQQGWVSGKYLSGIPSSEPTPPSTDYRSDAMALAKSMLGLWYRWGGNFTQEPFSAKRGDCSGFVGFVSDTMGYRPGDNKLYNYTADAMFDNFRDLQHRSRGEPCRERSNAARLFAASIIPERLFVRRDEMPVLDDDGSPLNYAYERTEDNIASLRVDLTRYPDPEEAADRLLMACDELAALLTEKGP